ncbi:hypothetical protein CHUAL_013327 [Chamberlinius hualienensis]
MFRRLKEKLSEEVSKSPLRLQSSVQSLGQLSPFKDEAKSDNSSDTSRESAASSLPVQNLIDLQEGDSAILDVSESQQFSITDDDGTPSAPTSPSSKPSEFTNVDLSEKDAGLLSIVTSHSAAAPPMKSPLMSNLLFPVYNPSTPVYRIQSDIESASEVEDSAINLDNISKERLYQAFLTAKSRYSTYKSRYSNAVKAYREQADEAGKIKAVLSETQDRAFRRISEMKEQSQLDQKAKAHLEDTYRTNLEEKDQLISVLHTQVRLLKNGEEIKDPKEVDQSLIEFDSQNDIATENADGDDLRLKVKRYEETIARLKGFLRNCKDTITKNREITTRLNSEKEDIKKQFENAIVRLSELEKQSSQKEINLKNQNSDAQEEIIRLKKIEAERGLQIAEYKKAMHDEMSSKEKEIESLKIQLKELVANGDELRRTVEAKAKQITEIEAANSTTMNMMQSLEQMEKSSEEEKQNLLQEMSRSKAAAIELIQQEFQRNIKDLKRENDDIVNKLEMEWQAKFRSKVEELEQQLNTEISAKQTTEELLKEAKSSCDELDSVRVKLSEMEAQLSEYKLISDDLQNNKPESDELQKIKSEYFSIIEQLECKKADYESLNEEFAKTKREYENISAEFENHRIDCQKVNEEVENIKVKLESAEEELTKKNTELESVTNEFDERKNEFESIKNDLEISRAEHQKLIEELEKARHECAIISSDIEEKKSGYESLREELQNKTSELENMKVVIDERNDEVEKLKVEVEQRDSTLENAKQQLEVKISEFDGLSEELEKKKTEHVEMQTQLVKEQKLKEEAQDRVEFLQSQVNEAMQNLNEEKSKFERLKEAVEAEREGLQAAGSVELEQLNMQLEDERRKVSKFEEKRRKLKLKHEKELQGVRQQLALELDNAKNIHHNLAAELEVSKSQLVAVEEQLFNIRTAMDAKETEIDMQKSELQSLKDTLETSSVVLMESQKLVASLTEEKNGLQFRFEEHLQNSAELETKMKEDNNRILSELKNKTKESIGSLKMQLKDAQDQLETEKHSFSARSVNYEEEVKQLENSLAIERSKNEESERRIQEIQLNLSDLSCVGEQERTELLQLKAEIDTLRESLQVANASLSKCQIERDSAKALLEETEFHISQMKQSADEAQQENILLTEKKILLETELQNLLFALNIESDSERLAKLEELKSSQVSGKLQQVLQLYCDGAVKLENDLKGAEERIGVLMETELKIKSLQSELIKLKEENVELTKRISTLQSDYAANEQEIRNLLQKNVDIEILESRLRSEDLTITQLKEELDRRREECVAHSADLERIQNLESSLLKEINGLKEEKTILSNKIEQLKMDSENQLKTMEDNCQKLWQTKIDSLVEEQQIKLSELKKRAENKLGQIKKQMTAETERIKDELSNRINELEQQIVAESNSHRATVSSLEKDANTVTELNQQIEVLKQQHFEEIESLSTTLTAAKQELEQERTRLLAEIQLKNDQLDESLITAQTNCTRMETEMNNLRTEFEATKTTWKLKESELEQLVDTLREKQLNTKDIDLLSQQHQLEIEELKNGYERSLKDKDDDYNSRVKGLLEESTKMISLREEESRQTLADTIERNMDDDARIRKEYEKQFIEIQQQLSEKEQSMEQILENNQTLLQDKTEQFNMTISNYEERISELKIQHKNDLDALQKKLKSAMDRELQLQSRSHDEELQGLSQEWNHERKLLSESDFNSIAEIEVVQEELQRQAELATSAVESGVQSTDLLQRQIRLLQNQIETLKEQHKSEVSELRQVLKMSSQTVPPNFIQRAQYRDHQLETLEIEYLRNILYEYMMGRETMVLAKVIAAVLKFDEDQTRKILEKEEIRGGGSAST